MVTFSDFLSLSFFKFLSLTQLLFILSPMTNTLDFFCENFITPGKPQARPEGSNGSYIPLKSSASNHFHYSIKPLA